MDDCLGLLMSKMLFNAKTFLSIRSEKHDELYIKIDIHTYVLCVYSFHTF